MSADLLVLGELNVDIILDCGDARLEFGQAEQLIDDAQLVLGSSGAITACGASRLGLDTAFAGIVGKDVYGDFVLSELEARGVDISRCVRSDKGPTGVSVILNRDGDRSILTHAGLIGHLSLQHVDADQLAAARHVHVSSYFLQRALWPDLPAMLVARRPDQSWSVDPNWDPSGGWDQGLLSALAQVDYFFPNEREAQLLTGESDVDRAADALAASGTTVVVKCGARGAVLVSGVHRFTAAATVEDPVDTTGAGDSFNAGFIAATLGGASRQEALCAGVLCGSLSTRRVGGTAGQATSDELAALMADSG